MIKVIDVKCKMVSKMCVAKAKIHLTRDEKKENNIAAKNIAGSMFSLGC